MGLNIQGFIINKDFSKTLDKIDACFNWKLTKQTDTTFEYAREDKFNKDTIDFYFTSKGTLAFVWEGYTSYFAFCDLSMLGEVIGFNLSERAMTFSFSRYVEDDCVGNHFFKMGRNGNWEDHNNQPFLKVGERDDLIFKTFSNILKEKLGKSMNEIDLSEKFYRYRMSYK